MEEEPSISREKHRAILVFIPLAISAFLRLYPSIIDGAPWGTDGWPLLRISNEILAHTPTAITGSSLFGSYDVYWPAASLFGAVSSLIFHVPPIVAMPIIIPLASSFTTLFIFVIVERITRSFKIACIASLFFATSSFDSIFTASITKETYAFPLFMAGMLLAFLLLFAEKNKIDAKTLVVFAVVVLVLATAHHATSMIFALIIFSLVLGRVLIGFGGHLFGFSIFFEGSLRNILTLPLITGVIVVGYLFGYALVALPIQITLAEIPYLFAFSILSFASAMFFVFERKIRKTNLLVPSLIYFVGVSLFALSEFTHIFPFVPVLPSSIAFDALPYLIVGGIVLAGYTLAQRRLPRPSFAFVAIWIAVPIALFGFATFALPSQAVNLYRLFTFLYAPVSIFAAIAFVPLLGSNKSFKFNVSRAGAIALIVVITLLGLSQSYAAVVQHSNFLAGQWAYTPTDLSAATWTNNSLVNNQTLAGDTKVSYLFSDYFGLAVNNELGYTDLSSNLGTPVKVPLVTYATMNQNGYNLFLYGEPLPYGWQTSLANSSSLIYNNGNDEIWN